MSLYRRLSRCHHQSHSPVSCDPLALLLLSSLPQCKAEEFIVLDVQGHHLTACPSGIAVCHTHPGPPCAVNALTLALGRTGQHWAAGVVCGFCISLFVPDDRRRVMAICPRQQAGLCGESGWLWGLMSRQQPPLSPTDAGLALETPPPRNIHRLFLGGRNELIHTIIDQLNYFQPLQALRKVPE